ncbi:MAG: AMP-binding protein [Acidimicrobiia bacterium]
MRASRLTSFADLGTAARVVARAGLFEPVAPPRLVHVARALRHWGFTLAGGFAASAARHPDRLAVVDERGSVTFDALHRRSNALAHGLRSEGFGTDTTIGVMCRNHAGFVEVTLALAKIGATGLQCNSGFAGAQLREVVAREKPAALIFDEEFTSVVRDGAPELPGFVAWHDGPTSEPTITSLIRNGSEADPPRPSQPGRTIILTSGTTGTPRGAARAQKGSIGPMVALGSVMPLRAGETTVIAAPLFHSWGFAHLVLALVLGSTVVLRRSFDPVRTLADVGKHRATVLVAVPVMLQRMLDVPASIRRGFDVSSLRAVVVSGSSLPGGLATQFMNAFGDVLYNLYGSTEVAHATLATPEDLRVDPHTAGRPLPHTDVVILDADDHPVPAGDRGRIFVGNDFLFGGYTGGGTKATVGRLMSTGDVGHFDADGRLSVDGREDDMIVSGGENVYPEEVEHLLADHEAIAEVAVVGIDDPQFGQRLKAFVVCQPGATLTAAEVRAHVRTHLARHKVPRDVEFTDMLPRNTTGKVLRSQLATPERVSVAEKSKQVG